MNELLTNPDGPAISWLAHLNLSSITQVSRRHWFLLDYVEESLRQRTMGRVLLTLLGQSNTLYIPVADGVMGLTVTLRRVCRELLPTTFSAWHPYSPESATDTFFNCSFSFHFDQELPFAIGFTSYRLWFMRVPSFEYTGTSESR